MSEEFSFEELLELVHQDDEYALDELYELYYPKICSLAYGSYSAVSYSGIDLQDLIQEGRISLYEAVKSYRHFSEAKFSTFFYLCCRRRMYSFVKKHNRQKNRILNESLSLQYEVCKNTPMIEFVQDHTCVNPIDELILCEQREDLYRSLKEVLSPFEKEIFELKMEGYSYTEIAKILNKPLKTVDNGLQRLKNKVKAYCY